MNNKYQKWADPIDADKYGNVQCKVCGEIQSQSFNACIHCCKHNVLNLIEEWHGPDDGGGWELDVECSICGKNFDFSRSYLIENYILVRRDNQ